MEYYLEGDQLETYNYMNNHVDSIFAVDSDIYTFKVHGRWFSRVVKNKDHANKVLNNCINEALELGPGSSRVIFPLV